MSHRFPPRPAQFFPVVGRANLEMSGARRG